MTYTLHTKGRGWTARFGLDYAEIIRRLPEIKTEARVDLDGREVGGVEKRRNDQGRNIWYWWLEVPEE